MFSLHPFQSQLVKDLYREIKTSPKRWKSPRVGVFSATGTGKTETIGKVIADLLSRGGRCLFVVDRLELCEQTADRFARRFGFPSAVCQGKHPLSDPAAPVQVGTWQTLTRRRQWLEAWMEPKDKSKILVVWDEAHETAWTTFAIEYLLPGTADREDVIHVMLTASPYRTKPTEGMADICDGMAAGLTPGEAMTGTPPYLTPDAYITVDMPDLSTVRLDRGGDYDETDLGDTMSAGPSIVAALDAIEEHTPSRRRLAFAVNVRHATAICDEAHRRGMRAITVTGETPLAVRKEAFLSLGSGRLDLLVNVGIAIKGLDIPEIDAILFSRPTKSRALWIQAIGRGLRLSPGKTDCIILDQGDCVERFGRARDLAPYKLIAGRPPGEPKEDQEPGGELQPWLCIHCGYEDNPIQQPACRQCGERKPKRATAKIDPPIDGYCCVVGGQLRGMAAKVHYVGEEKGTGRWFVAGLKHPKDLQWYSVCGLIPPSADIVPSKGDWVLLHGKVSAHTEHQGKRAARLVKVNVFPDRQYLSL